MASPTPSQSPWELLPDNEYAEATYVIAQIREAQKSGKNSIRFNLGMSENVVHGLLTKGYRVKEKGYKMVVRWAPDGENMKD